MTLEKELAGIEEKLIYSERLGKQLEKNGKEENYEYMIARGLKTNYLYQFVFKYNKVFNPL